MHLAWLEKLLGRSKRDEKFSSSDLYITATFSKKAANRIQTLREFVGAKDCAELIPDALRLYEYFVQEKHLGTTFYKKEAGSDELVPIAIMEIAGISREGKHEDQKDDEDKE